MNTNGRYRPETVAIFAALGLLFTGALQSPALSAEPAQTAGDSSSLTKAPEVSTVGAGPYIGPLPEELAKLAEIQTPSVESPTQQKEPDAATITTSGGNTLTAAELAKLAALPVVTPTPLILAMLKLEIMDIPTAGIPELTAEELDKRAMELAAPAAPRVFAPVAPIAPTAPQSLAPVAPAPATTPTPTPESAR